MAHEKKSMAFTWLLLLSGSAFAWLQYNKPVLHYQWLNATTVQFTLSKGSKNISGTVNLSPDNITDNVQWIGNTAFSVISQADSVLFQIQEGDNIIFSKTVTPIT